MLRSRILVGIILVAIFSAVCWFEYHTATPGIFLVPAVLVVAMMAADEMITLLSVRTPAPLAGVAFVGTAIVIGSCAVPIFWTDYAAESFVGFLGWPLLGLTFAIMLAFLGEMQYYRGPQQIIERLAKTLMPPLYIGVLLSFALQLRIVAEGATGLWALLSMMVVVKMSDTGQYALGRTFGKHKMVPVLSPGKTWEGALGGLLFALLGAWLVLHVFTRGLELPGYPGEPKPWWGWCVFAVAVAVSGLLGDLAMSMLKREAGLKNSSRWLPGMGGVLDVFDSVFWAAPAAYLCWLADIVGP